MKEEEKIKILSDKYLGNLPLEQPAADFSDKIMQQLQVTTVDHSYFMYKPLISKRGWAAIFCMLGVFVGYYSIYGDKNITSQEFEWVATKIQAFLSIAPMQTLPQMSGTFISIMLIFSVMAIIELTILNKIFNYRSSQ